MEVKGKQIQFKKPFWKISLCYIHACDYLNKNKMNIFIQFYESDVKILLNYQTLMKPLNSCIQDGKTVTAQTIGK